MEHTQRKTALGTRDLIVIKLHRVDGAAAELVILRVRSEDRTQQDAGLRSLGMPCEAGGITLMRSAFKTAGMSLQFFSSSVSPHMPLV